eukprot:ANDGO_03690.mRNA.1 hypothetical protein
MRSRKSGLQGEGGFMSGSSSSSSSEQKLHRELTFYTSEHMVSSRTIVFLDPQRVDAAFKFDPKYVPRHAHGTKRERGNIKYKDAKEALKVNRVVPVPAACLYYMINPTNTASACSLAMNTVTHLPPISPTKLSERTVYVGQASPTASTAWTTEPEKSNPAKSMSPPLQRVVDDSSTEKFIHISHGAYLFCVLRDGRIPCIPFLVPTEERAAFEKLYGVANVSLYPEVQIRAKSFVEEDLFPWRSGERYKKEMETTIAKINSLQNLSLKNSLLKDHNADGDSSAASPDEKTRLTAEEGINTSHVRKPAHMPSMEEIFELQKNLKFFVSETSLIGRQIVYVDLQKVNQSFFYDRKYVGPGGRGSRRKRSFQAYQDIRKKVRSCQTVPVIAAQLLDADEVDISIDRRTIDLVELVVHFVEGSHLFAVLRDAGCPSIPLLVMEEEAEAFESEFGVTDPALCEGEPAYLLDPPAKPSEQTGDSPHVWSQPPVEIRSKDEVEHPWRRGWKKEQSAGKRSGHSMTV